MCKRSKQIRCKYCMSKCHFYSKKVMSASKSLINCTIFDIILPFELNTTIKILILLMTYYTRNKDQFGA